ncbi:glycoside hydrolase family 16 protein [Biscogniauxia marginata]|nr:glycoside hydrolase family 16 protein [Biscogniauxia marginata]
MAYSLSTHYAGQGLLDSFSFFTGNDPSNGFVDYQSRDDALAKNIVSIDESNRVRLGVDSTNTYLTSDKGRPSVRLTSNNDFTHGLFIADFAHMPASSCGTWPTFWAFNNQDDGEEWPVGGELEIIEGASTAERNLFSAHTSAGCEAPCDGVSGVQGLKDCSRSPDNFGCNYASPISDTTSYGDAFNAGGGGVYALEWDSEDLKIWHFPRSAIPDDISFAPVTNPDPSTWGPPQAIFGGSSCDPDTYFFNMSLAINTNFCGDYAGKNWGVTDQCNTLAPTCEDYVAANPDSFKGAYWDINYIDVYQRGAPKGVTTPPISSELPTLSAPSVSRVTSVASLNGTAPPMSTRTITLTTVTQVIVTAEPTQTGGGLVDPSIINGYTLLGCFGSSAGYQAFAPIASFAGMDNEACVASCAGRKYAGVSDETCYCADVLGDASAVPNEMCNTPCPKNAREFCGGQLDASSASTPGAIGMGVKLVAPTNSTSANNSTAALSQRPAPPDILLTVYGALGSSPSPPGAPALGGSAPTPAPTSVAVTTALTVTYTTVCATNPAILTALAYTTTVTYADFGCAAAVPMATCTRPCRGCGPRGESTVMLTVPAALYAAEEVTVTAVAVQTVVPVRLNSTVNSATATITSSGGNVTLNANGTVVGPTVVPPPPPPPSMPVEGAAAGLSSWGSGLLLGILGVVMVL